MYELFSEEARQAMQVANRLAMESGHENILPEHMFLAILSQEGTVTQACQSLGVPPSVLAQAILTQLEHVESGPVPRAKMVIELAIEKRKMLGHLEVGTHHIALAIFRELDESLASALESVGISPAKLLAEILRRHPAGEKPEPSLEELLKLYQDHVDVRRVNGDLERIQRAKEDAVANQDWETAARLRDEGQTQLRALIQLLKRQSDQSTDT